MRYTSKPHTIEAFKFVHNDTKPPKWFLEAVEVGRAAVTMNHREMYITLYTKPGDSVRAYKSDWICKNNNDTLFVLDDESFNDEFVPTASAEKV